jgi:GNAT superfamily N-acetyltransferase
MEELYRHERIRWSTEVARPAVEELLSKNEQGGAWLIEMEEEVIGYCVLTMAFSLEFGGKFALLDELFIRDEWRGKGIGGAALQFIERQSRRLGAKALRLEAGYANPDATRFYERNQFRREERYLMTKRLD